MYWDVGLFFFVKQKTAYEVRIRDWSSDVCSSDLAGDSAGFFAAAVGAVAPAAKLEERGAGLRLFRRGAGAVARAGTSSGMVRRAGEMGACDGGVGQSATRPADGDATARAGDDDAPAGEAAEGDAERPVGSRSHRPDEGTSRHYTTVVPGPCQDE